MVVFMLLFMVLYTSAYYVSMSKLRQSKTWKYPPYAHMRKRPE